MSLGQLRQLKQLRRDFGRSPERKWVSFMPQAPGKTMARPLGRQMERTDHSKPRLFHLLLHWDSSRSLYAHTRIVWVEIFEKSEVLNATPVLEAEAHQL